MTGYSSASVRTFAEVPGDTVRERLLNSLTLDLMGPESDDEVLGQSPATRYLLGMLAPSGTTLAASEDEQNDSSAEGDETSDGRMRISQSLAPSSIGISFIIGADYEAVTAVASWGEYEKVQRPRAAEVDASEATDIDPDADPEDTATRQHREHEWARTPLEKSLTIDVTRSPGSAPISEGVALRWLVEPVAERLIVSVFLVNVRIAPSDKRPPDELWLYQPQLRVVGTGSPFENRRLPRELPDPDPDVASADLVYRNRREFAVGHGVAAEWNVDSDDDTRASEVRTAILPRQEVHRVQGPADIPVLSMDRLAEAATPEAVTAIIEPLLSAYSTWIDERRDEQQRIAQPDAAVAVEHIAAQKRSLQRMRNGLGTLVRDPTAREAFRFANRAMGMQRRASVRVLAHRRSDPVPDDSQIAAEWRPFQIGFILQAITGLVDPTDVDREVADLLWYPTGGGKTEAYLGLTAFTFALRRLWGRRAGFDFAVGTAVLMRYTLRLLTIQQFQRALALTCACEVIRREDEGKWGATPFSIGLWVGQSVTPNTYTDAKAALTRLRRGDRVYQGSPYQILFCPWCGDDITPEHYDSNDESERTLIKCWGPDCAFGARNSEFGLPAVLVDREIYRYPPSLVLATVDKFAQMAWNGRIRSLFGRVDRHCPRHGYVGQGEQHANSHRETSASRAAIVGPVEAPPAPPELIIQDELHLISGPLGSLVGIYESVVDGLCTRTEENAPIRPKIVTSTATVRRARRQLRALFDRDSDIFPALGIDAADSFFGIEERESSGRLYVGVFAPGKSIKSTLVRTYAALLSRGKYEFDRAVAASSDENVADSYMTLVGYFNSLRELGGALRLLDDDVPARLRVLFNRGFGPDRLLYEKDRELTSRRSSFQISDTLKALDRTFRTRESGAYPIDVLLASNMISVGVDIDRLGLMVVSAQPRTSAEYIQATSRVGRTHPGLIVEVYNWVRPRDISHYERFGHYHDTFYRHVEATSVTPFSERARDRALPGVFASFVRQAVPGLAGPEAAADRFEVAVPAVETIINALSARAESISESEDVAAETHASLTKLADEWNRWAEGDAELVYSRRGLGGRQGGAAKAVLMRPMEQNAGKGSWPVAGSLREVEEEVDVVLLSDMET